MFARITVSLDKCFQGSLSLWTDVCQDYGLSEQIFSRITVSLDKCLPGLLSLWTNVFRDHCLSRQMFSRITVSLDRCLSWLLSIWATILPDYCIYAPPPHHPCVPDDLLCVIICNRGQEHISQALLDQHYYFIETALANIFTFIQIKGVG